jgi:hypothetical protein
MNSRDSISFRLIWLWFLILLSGLVTAYLGFVALVSVWVGVAHLNQPGCWVPILAGLFLFIGLCSFFLRILKRLLGRLRNQAVVNI